MIEWRQVDLDGARAHGLVNRTPYGRGILVTGQVEEAAYVAGVSADGRVERQLGGGTAPVWSAMVPELDAQWICGTPPRSFPGDDTESLLTDSPDEPPVRAWEVCGDEDPCTLTLRADGQLFAYEPGGESPTGGVWLADGAPHVAGALTVAGAEIGLLVGGPVADAPGGDRAPQAWRYAGEEWERVVLDESPDAFTDSYSRWEPVLAGHRHGEPVVFSHAGTRLAAPRVRLDVAHPMVTIAHVDGPPYESAHPDWGGRLSLVVQEEQGVQLWLQHAHGWSMLPGPPGRLRAARLGHNQKWAGWCVTDDRLWFADLSGIWGALP